MAQGDVSKLKCQLRLANMDQRGLTRGRVSRARVQYAYSRH